MKTKSKYQLRAKITDIYHNIKPANFSAPKFPKKIMLEPSAVCNAKCVTCPKHLITRKEILNIDAVKKIIDECAAEGLESFTPVNYNEFFLYPNWLELLRYAKQKLKDTQIYTFSNGSVLTKDKTDKIINEHLIDEMIFSLDAFTKETYEKVRGLNYDRTIENVNYFISKHKENNSQIKLSVSFTISNQNEHELNDFKAYWTKNNIHVSVSTDDGRINKPYVKKNITAPCSNLFSSFVICSNGEVIPCCIDYKNTFVMGNIHKSTLKEIWNSEKYNKLREMHLKGDRNRIMPCANCQIS